MDMTEAMERIPKVRLTGLDGKGDTGTKGICEVSNMSGLQCYCQRKEYGGENWVGKVGVGKNKKDRSHFKA